MESQVTETKIDSSDIIDLSLWQEQGKTTSQTRHSKQLMQLYIEEVKGQGVCDYPHLVEVIQKAYQVEQDPSLLLPSEATALLGTLADYQGTQSQIADRLRWSMDELGETFDRGLAVITPEDLRCSMAKIHSVLAEFDEIAIQFQGLTERLQIFPSKWWHWFLPPDSESQQLFHLCDSLQYCHRYLVAHLSLGTLVKAKQEKMDWLTFAKRLYAYVDESVSVVDQLANMLQQRVQER